MPTFNDKEQNKRYSEIRKIEEEAFVENISKKFKIPYIDLSSVSIETDALGLIPESESVEAEIAAFKVNGKKLHVAIKSPINQQTKDYIDKLNKIYEVVAYLVSQKSLDKAWSRYSDISKSAATHGGLLDISPERLVKLSSEIQNNADIERRVLETLTGKGTKKTTELMEIIFGGAIATKTSDIHIEAQAEAVRLRYRQDGVLQDITTIDTISYEKLLSRIKLLSEMKITQRENAQDGRFTIDYDDKEIEVRVSVIPSAYGESFVMRILNPDGINVGIENLGIEPKLYEILKKEIRKPNGMILTTGPTGSGKTTTLYSFVREVYNPEVKILTIEDPIEYHLKGISQTQVNKDKGYTFLSGLRAALRQDPDIVMVGEIRDGETATIAVNASLTGHLVLSTLHTNGAAGVIPRLIDLGVSPQILAASLSVSLAQRLVRKICSNCSTTVEPTDEQRNIIVKILKRAVENGKKISDYGMAVDQEIVLRKANGCEKCNNTGYKGRIGIFEAIITDDLIEELLNKKPSEQEVQRVANKQGLLSMAEDGVIKILNGVTSFSEVVSVVDLEIKEIAYNNSQESIANEKLDAPVNGIVTTQKMIQKEQSADVIKKEEKVLSNEGSAVEVSLLLEYLQKLEHEQTIDPDVDASEKIKILEHTILNLLRKQDSFEIFSQDQKVHEIQQKLENISKELSELHGHQVYNTQLRTAPKIKQIKEDLSEILV